MVPSKPKPSSWKQERFTGFSIITLSYVLAMFVGLMVFARLPYDLWLRILVADIAATVVIWISSLLFGNASVYDPYWSIQPIVIVNLLLFQVGVFHMSALLLCLVINIWGIRLTANWATTSRGLHVQDWRYDLIREQTKGLYPIVSFVGIQLMPTLIVFACILPAVHIVSSDRPVFNGYIVFGLLLSITGVTLEALSDYQMHEFRRQNTDLSKINRNGLWRHARHPNYCGEILMWWGVYVVMLSMNPSLWMLGIGAVLNTMLFLLISIPMAERKLAAYKESFDSYKAETRLLIPLPKR